MSAVDSLLQRLRGRREVARPGDGVARFLVTKVSWRGSYRRVFVVTRAGFVTQYPDTLAPTNAWLFAGRHGAGEGEGAAAAPAGVLADDNPDSDDPRSHQDAAVFLEAKVDEASGSRHPDGPTFTIRFRKPNGKESEARFACSTRASLLTTLHRARAAGLGGGLGRPRAPPALAPPAIEFECYKLRRGRWVPATLVVTAWGVSRLDAATGYVRWGIEFQHLSSPAVRVLAPEPGLPPLHEPLALFARVGRSPRVFALRDRDALVRAVREAAAASVGVRAAVDDRGALTGGALLRAVAGATAERAASAAEVPLSSWDVLCIRPEDGGGGADLNLSASASGCGWGDGDSACGAGGGRRPSSPSPARSPPPQSRVARRRLVLTRSALLERRASDDTVAAWHQLACVAALVRYGDEPTWAGLEFGDGAPACTFVTPRRDALLAGVLDAAQLAAGRAIPVLASPTRLGDVLAVRSGQALRAPIPTRDEALERLALGWLAASAREFIAYGGLAAGPASLAAAAAAADAGAGGEDDDGADGQGLWEEGLGLAGAAGPGAPQTAGGDAWGGAPGGGDVAPAGASALSRRSSAGGAGGHWGASGGSVTAGGRVAGDGPPGAPPPGKAVGSMLVPASRRGGARRLAAFATRLRWFNSCVAYGGVGRATRVEEQVLLAVLAHLPRPPPAAASTRGAGAGAPSAPVPTAQAEVAVRALGALHRLVASASAAGAVLGSTAGAGRFFASLGSGTPHISADAARLIARLCSPRAGRTGGVPWTLATGSRVGGVAAQIAAAAAGVDTAAAGAGGAAADGSPARLSSRGPVAFSAAGGAGLGPPGAASTPGQIGPGGSPGGLVGAFAAGFAAAGTAGGIGGRGLGSASGPGDPSSAVSALLSAQATSHFLDGDPDPDPDDADADGDADAQAARAAKGVLFLAPSRCLALVACLLPGAYADAVANALSVGGAAAAAAGAAGGEPSAIVSPGSAPARANAAPSPLVTLAASECLAAILCEPGSRTTDQATLDVCLGALSRSGRALFSLFGHPAPRVSDAVALLMRAVAEGGAGRAAPLREAALAEGALLGQLGAALRAPRSPEARLGRELVALWCDAHSPSLELLSRVFPRGLLRALVAPRRPGGAALGSETAARTAPARLRYAGRAVRFRDEEREAARVADPGAAIVRAERRARFEERQRRAPAGDEAGGAPAGAGAGPGGVGPAGPPHASPAPAGAAAAEGGDPGRGRSLTREARAGPEAPGEADRPPASQPIPTGGTSAAAGGRPPASPLPSSAPVRPTGAYPPLPSGPTRGEGGLSSSLRSQRSEAVPVPTARGMRRSNSSGGSFRGGSAGSSGGASRSPLTAAASPRTYDYAPPDLTAPAPLTPAVDRGGRAASPAPAPLAAAASPEVFGRAPRELSAASTPEGGSSPVSGPTVARAGPGARDARGAGRPPSPPGAAPGSAGAPDSPGAPAASGPAQVAAEAAAAQLRQRPGTLRYNWPAFWSAVDRDHCHAALVWNERMRGELRAALAAEARLLSRARAARADALQRARAADARAADARAAAPDGQADTAAADPAHADPAHARATALPPAFISPDPAWNSAEFSVCYPSLSRRLCVEGVYVRLLLEGEDPEAVSRLDIPGDLFGALWRRFLLESAGGLERAGGAGQAVGDVGDSGGGGGPGAVPGPGAGVAAASPRALVPGSRAAGSADDDARDARALCLRAMAAVYRRHAGALGPFRDASALVALADFAPDVAQRDHAFDLIAAVLRPDGVEEAGSGGGGADADASPGDVSRDPRAAGARQAAARNASELARAGVVPVLLHRVASAHEVRRGAGPAWEALARKGSAGGAPWPAAIGHGGGAPADGAGTPAPGVRAPAAPSPLAMWHYHSGARPAALLEGPRSGEGGWVGPLLRREVVALYDAGVVTRSTPVWRGGLTRPEALRDVRELRWLTTPGAAEAGGDGAAGPAAGAAALAEGRLAGARDALRSLRQLLALNPATSPSGEPLLPLPVAWRATCTPEAAGVLAASALAGDPQLAAEAAEALLQTCLADPDAEAVLYRSGAFFTLLLGARQGDAGEAAARLFARTHARQAEAGRAGAGASDGSERGGGRGGAGGEGGGPGGQRRSLAARSFLGTLLPSSLLHVLERRGPAAFARALASDSDTPELIWTHGMRDARLLPHLATHLGDFPLRLAECCSLAYEYQPVPPLSYPEIRRELWCHRYYLRHLTDERRFPAWPIVEHLPLLQSLLDAWRGELAQRAPDLTEAAARRELGLPERGTLPEEALRSAYRQAARRFHPDRNPAGRERFEAITRAYVRLQDREARGDEGAAYWRVALLLRAQALVFSRSPGLLAPYKYAGYPLLVRTLRGLDEAPAGHRDGSSPPAGADPSGRGPAGEAPPRAPAAGGTPGAPRHSAPGLDPIEDRASCLAEAARLCRLTLACSLGNSGELARCGGTAELVELIARGWPVDLSPRAPPSRGPAPHGPGRAPPAVAADAMRALAAATSSATAREDLAAEPGLDAFARAVLDRVSGREDPDDGGARVDGGPDDARAGRRGDDGAAPRTAPPGRPAPPSTLDEAAAAIALVTHLCQGAELQEAMLAAGALGVLLRACLWYDPSAEPGAEVEGDEPSGATGLGPGIGSAGPPPPPDPACGSANPARLEREIEAQARLPEGDVSSRYEPDDGDPPAVGVAAPSAAEAAREGREAEPGQLRRNVLAVRAARALAALCGVPGASPRSQANGRAAAALLGMLPRSLARGLTSPRPRAALARLGSSACAPHLIWSPEMRRELLAACALEARSPDLDRCARHRYEALQGELLVAGVYVSAFLANPRARLEDPAAFCRGLVTLVHARFATPKGGEPGEGGGDDDARAAAARARPATPRAGSPRAASPPAPPPPPGDAETLLALRALSVLLELHARLLGVVSTRAALAPLLDALEPAAARGDPPSRAGWPESPIREDERAGMAVAGASLSVLLQATGHAGCVAALAATPRATVLALRVAHRAPDAAARADALRLLGALASSPAAGEAAAERGGAVLLLGVLFPTARCREDSQAALAEAHAASAAALLSALAASSLHGARLLRALRALVPEALLRRLLEDPGPQALGAARSEAEQPDLIWTSSMAARLSREVARLADDLREELPTREAARPEALWRLPEGFSVCYPELMDELFVGGVYVRLFLRQPRWPVRDPAGLLQALLERYCHAVSAAGGGEGGDGDGAPAPGSPRSLAAGPRGGAAGVEAAGGAIVAAGGGSAYAPAGGAPLASRAARGAASRSPAANLLAAVSAASAERLTEGAGALAEADLALLLSSTAVALLDATPSAADPIVALGYQGRVLRLLARRVPPVPGPDGEGALLFVADPVAGSLLRVLHALAAGGASGEALAAGPEPAARVLAASLAWQPPACALGLETMLRALSRANRARDRLVAGALAVRLPEVLLALLRRSTEDASLGRRGRARAAVPPEAGGAEGAAPSPARQSPGDGRAAALLRVLLVDLLNALRVPGSGSEAVEDLLRSSPVWRQHDGARHDMFLPPGDTEGTGGIVALLAAADERSAAFALPPPELTASPASRRRAAGGGAAADDPRDRGRPWARGSDGEGAALARPASADGDVAAARPASGDARPDAGEDGAAGDDAAGPALAGAAPTRPPSPPGERGARAGPPSPSPLDAPPAGGPYADQPADRRVAPPTLSFDSSSANEGAGQDRPADLGQDEGSGAAPQRLSGGGFGRLSLYESKDGDEDGEEVESTPRGECARPGEAERNGDGPGLSRAAPAARPPLPAPTVDAEAVVGLPEDLFEAQQALSRREAEGEAEDAGPAALPPFPGARQVAPPLPSGVRPAVAPPPAASPWPSGRNPLAPAGSSSLQDANGPPLSVVDPLDTSSSTLEAVDPLGSFSTPPRLKRSPSRQASSPTPPTLEADDGAITRVRLSSGNSPL